MRLVSWHGRGWTSVCKRCTSVYECWADCLNQDFLDCLDFQDAAGFLVRTWLDGRLQALDERLRDMYVRLREFACCLNCSSCSMCDGLCFELGWRRGFRTIVGAGCARVVRTLIWWGELDVSCRVKSGNVGLSRLKSGKVGRFFFFRSLLSLRFCISFFVSRVDSRFWQVLYDAHPLL